VEISTNEHDVFENLLSLSRIQATVVKTAVGRSLEDIQEEKANELRVMLPKLFDLEVLKNK